MTDRNRRLLSYGLSVAIVLALAGAVLVTVLGNGASSASSSTQESAAREDVQRVASSFAANVNTYSSRDIDGYSERVKPLLTDKFEGSFSRAIQGIVAQMRSAQIESQGEVLVTGVSSVDQDSATVLVVVDADVSTAVGERARHFRWEVDLVRQQGKWLVDGFEST
jgi:Mce-associated membrane protein